MIVCNTLSKAVTEYSRHAFQSITATHAGGAAGLFALQGSTDDGLPIVASVQLPATLRDDTRKKHIQAVYVSVTSAGSLQVEVFGKTQSWKYAMPVRASGQSRCDVGRGIRENYLGLALSNPAGQAFAIDRVEILEATSQRRI